jgi:hypothetical protein
LSEKKQDKAKNITVDEKPEICENPLLCPEEWEARPGEKILGEYHKDSHSTTATGEEADLESFEKYWNSANGGNISSEYHKEGRPHLHDRGEVPINDAAQVEAIETDAGSKHEEEQVASKTSPGESTRNVETPDEVDHEKVNRSIDLHAIEMISYAIVRALFSQGITLPIKREGIIDMELTVRGKDIILDNKEMFPISIPDLVVWRVIYAYKGKPVLELGRGVKKGLKVHAFRALVMLVDMWRGNRKQRRMVKRKERAKIKAGGESK